MESLQRFALQRYETMSASFHFARPMMKSIKHSPVNVREFNISRRAIYEFHLVFDLPSLTYGKCIGEV